MIHLYFHNGLVIIPNLEDYSHIFSSGATRVAFFEGKQVDNYVLLNDKNSPEPSYIDICENIDGECVVTGHFPILNVSVDLNVYDEAFVRRFDPVALKAHPSISERILMKCAEWGFLRKIKLGTDR